MSVIVRYAPSPTGFLHVGHVRAALFNWLFAKKHTGWFLLRIDDTDAERSEAQYEKAILEDLGWLGLKHTSFARQSDRIAEYEGAAEKLKAAGLLYACYETPDELERKRKRQLGRGQAPVYDRAALKLTEAEKSAFEAEGRRAHWRFKLPDEVAQWNDLIRGPTEIALSSVSDPVLIRSDGKFLYTLPSVVDDIFYAIAHVIRGEDHATNTAPQIALFKALGAAPPVFAHFPRLVSAEGGALSKRLGSLAIRDLRNEGYEPLAILSLFAKIGTSDPVEPALSPEALADGFDFAKISRTPARFDEAELSTLNARVLHHMPFAAAAPRLAELGLPTDEMFWEAVHGNLTKIGDVKDWLKVTKGPLAPVIEDDALLAEAAKRLPQGPFSEETWSVWTKDLSTATGKKGKALYHPLRLALTGRGDGPEMKNLLVLIGPDRARARLLGQMA